MAVASRGALPPLAASGGAVTHGRAASGAGGASSAPSSSVNFVSTVLGHAPAHDDGGEVLSEYEACVSRRRETRHGAVTRAAPAHSANRRAKPVPLAKLRTHSIDEVRGKREPIVVPRDVADMYMDLTIARERVTAAMWQLLLQYRKALKSLPERFAWRHFLALLRRHADGKTLDQRTFTAAVQEQYRFPVGYVEDEENEKLKLRKLAWRDTLQEIEDALIAAMPMLGTEVGKPPHTTRFLDVRDLEMCMYFLNEQEKPLHGIIARGTRIYSAAPKASEACIHLRDFMKVITLPVYRNAHRRELAVSIVKAVQAGTVVPVAPLHFSEAGVSMLLRASRLSTLLLPNRAASSLYMEVSNLEAMYAPALREKLLRRKQKLGKMRLADRMFLKNHGKPLFTHWARLWYGRRRIATLLQRMERRITLAWAARALRHWRSRLLQDATATRLAAAFRGFRVRMAFFRASQARFIADAIGAAYHWRTVEKHLHRRAVVEDLAAVTIQRIARGVVGRKRFVARFMAEVPPPRLAMALAMRRAGTEHAHAPALVIQCAYRRYRAITLADVLWAARAASEAAAAEAEAETRAKATVALKGMAVVERMVAARLRERMAEDQGVAQALVAANQVSTLRSKRKHAAKKRQLEEDAATVRKSQAAALLAFNAEWDEKTSTACGKEQEKWEALVLFKRPEEGDADAARVWDTAKGAYMKIAKALASQRKNGVEQNIPDAKEAFVQGKVDAVAADMRTRRTVARKKAADALAGELLAFRKQRAAASNLGEADAMEKIGAFIAHCMKRSALRAALREEWEKSYDLLQGAYFYVNKRTGTVMYRKPALLGGTDVAIVNRWSVLASTDGTLTYYFNPRTHALSWKQPPYTILCPRCSGAFVAYTCAEGCGDMCAPCWSEAHPSQDANLAIHSWVGTDGGRPVHILAQPDANRLYAGAVLGDDAAHGMVTPAAQDAQVRREALADAADSAMVEMMAAGAKKEAPPREPVAPPPPDPGVRFAPEEEGGGEGDWEVQYDEEGGYVDEEGGYVDAEGGYTDVDGVYFPPAGAAAS